MNRRRFVTTSLSIVAALGGQEAEARDFALDPTANIIKASNDPTNSGFRYVADVPPSPLPPSISVMLSPDVSALHYTGPGDSAKILQVVPVTGQSFPQALHVNTLDVVKSATKDFYGLYANLIAPAKKGDVLWISFYARTIEAQRESGEAYFQLRLDQLVDGKYKWPPYIEPGVFVGREWTQISIPYIMERDVTPDTMRLVLNFDKYPQRFEISPITFLNYGSAIKITDLPRSVAKYGGSEPDAPWRKAAADRIEQHRKGDLSVKVVDATGKGNRAVLSASPARQHA